MCDEVGSENSFFIVYCPDTYITHKTYIMLHLFVMEWIFLILFRMGLFGTAQGWGWGKKATPP